MVGCGTRFFFPFPIMCTFQKIQHFQNSPLIGVYFKWDSITTCKLTHQLVGHCGGFLVWHSECFRPFCEIISNDYYISVSSCGLGQRANNIQCDSLHGGPHIVLLHLPLVSWQALFLRHIDHNLYTISLYIGCTVANIIFAVCASLFCWYRSDHKWGDCAEA